MEIKTLNVMTFELIISSTPQRVLVSRPTRVRDSSGSFLVVFLLLSRYHFGNRRTVVQPSRK